MATKREMKLIFDNQDFIDYFNRKSKTNQVDCKKCCFDNWNETIKENPKMLFFYIKEYLQKKYYFSIREYKKKSVVVSMLGCNNDCIVKEIFYKNEWDLLMNIWEWLIKNSKEVAK